MSHCDDNLIFVNDWQGERRRYKNNKATCNLYAFEINKKLVSDANEVI